MTNKFMRWELFDILFIAIKNIYSELGVKIRRMLL